MQVESTLLIALFQVVSLMLFCPCHASISWDTTYNSRVRLWNTFKLKGFSANFCKEWLE